MTPARVVSADCPWLFRDKLPGKKRGASKNYNCMPTWQLMRFPLPPLADDAWLFLWYVTSMRADADKVAEAWGFKPTGAELVWVKTTGDEALIVDPAAEIVPQRKRASDDADYTRLTFGMGRTVRNCDERCIIARRGRPKRASASVRSVFFAPVGEHSEKPNTFYQLVEQLTGDGPRVELFARKHREGWLCFGDELPEEATP